MSLNRKHLARLVGVMSAMLVAAFVWVLFSGVFSGRSSTANNDDFSNIAEGHTVMRIINRQRVWVTLLSKAQREQLERFGDNVIVGGQGCELTETFCVISAATARTGIELRFVGGSPPLLPEGLPWAGGFINPDTRAVYDLVGRPYAFQGEVAPLSVLDAR